MNTYGSNSYEWYERTSASKHDRRCIDGKITGCGKCVGYCQYSGHPGFLTESLRRQHDCINKNCNYYVAKVKRNLRSNNAYIKSTSEIIGIANLLVSGFEGLKIIKATSDNALEWTLHYVAISNCYPINQISEEIAKASGALIRMKKLNYSFDICTSLILSF